MNSEFSDLRTAVAALAQEYLDAKLDYTSFLRRLPDGAATSTDPDIEELLDLIEHEPAIGRFLGVSRDEHAEYRQQMMNMINKLQGR